MLNMDKVYLAIKKTSLDGGVIQGAGQPPKEEAPLNGAGAQEDMVEAPQDNVDQPDNFKAEAFGQMMVNFQQLQNVVGK